MEINNEQLQLVLHANMNSGTVHDVIKNIIRDEMKKVISETYNINSLCREVIIKEILKDKLLETNDMLTVTVKKEVESLCSSDKIKTAVEGKLTGYGSLFISDAIKEMQPYINGRVAEVVKDADMKDVMKSVSNKISNRLFSAIQDGYED